MPDAFENGAKSAPSNSSRADAFASMRESSPNPGPPPGPLAGAAVVDQLARWDELPPEAFSRLSLDPEVGPQLDLLRRAEDWLTSGGNPPEPCPSPEALFEYAGGPGAEPIGVTAWTQVAEHLRHCDDCAGLVTSLAQQPSEDLLAGRPEAPRLRLVRGASLAAAALVAIAFVPRWLNPGHATQAAASAWPSVDHLRGPGDGALLSPGDSILAASLGAPWSADLIFEVEPVERASAYRVKVLAHSGSAFDAGEAILNLQDSAPQLRATQLLAAGHYTWEAWAEVDGREIQLGTRDFQLREDDSAREAVEAALANDGAGRVRVLHEARLFHDARRAAEALPASPERDAYLEMGW